MLIACVFTYSLLILFVFACCVAFVIQVILQLMYPSEGCFSDVTRPRDASVMFNHSTNNIHLYFLLKSVFNQSKKTIRLYFLENSVLNHSKNNYPSLLVAKECVQSFQKQLSAFTFCKRWCSIIPKTTAIRFYLLQNFVFNHSQNKYPPLPVATNAAQSFQKQLSAFTFC